MESWIAICGLFAAIVSMVLDVAQFWRDVSLVLYMHGNVHLANHPTLQKLLSWWRSKSPRDRILHRLKVAQTYEEWEEAAFELDELLSMDLWYACLLLFSTCWVLDCLIRYTGVRTQPVAIMTIDSFSGDWRPS